MVHVVIFPYRATAPRTLARHWLTLLVRGNAVFDGGSPEITIAALRRWTPPQLKITYLVRPPHDYSRDVRSLRIQPLPAIGVTSWF
ncbi:unnamed protein product, partial [Iphiclides podalirius]